MSTWRAKHYSATFGRRHRVNLTVRRFRLAKKPKRQGRARQLTVNLRLGRIRQLQLEFRRIGRVKRPKANWRYRFAAVALILAGCCGLTLNVVALSKPKSLEPAKTFTTSQAKPVVPVTLPKSIPTHISIASQGIDTDLTPVGLNPDGSIELPPVLDWVAGWYKYGPTPGELGPAVIVGHVDSYENISVFWNLRYVKPGDSIEVTRTDGRAAHFKVTQLSQYDQHDFPTDTVYGNTSDAELRVITCGGTFDTGTGHYTENTVVYATLVS